MALLAHLRRSGRPAPPSTLHQQGPADGRGFIHVMHIANRNDYAGCAQKVAFFLSEIDNKYSNFLRLKNICRPRILTNPAFP
jgi:hypothetical protein